MNKLKIGIQGSNKTYNSFEEMIEDWKKEDREFKDNHYWKWLFKETKRNIEFKWDKITTFWYDLKYGIKNLIKWFPVIWKDRNWDSHYLLLIVKKKLELIETEIRSNDRHTQSQEDAKQIRHCIELIRRITDEDYKNKSYNGEDFSHYQKKNESYIDSELLYKLKEKYKNNKSIKKRIINLQYSFSYLMVEDSLIKQDLNTLFKIMSKNIRHWWD